MKCNKETVTYQIDPPKPPKGGRRGSAELDGAVKSLLAEYAAGDTELAEALDALMEIRAAKKAVDSTRAVTTLLNRLNRLSDNSREVKLQILDAVRDQQLEGHFPAERRTGPNEKGAKTICRITPRSSATCCSTTPAT